MIIQNINNTLYHLNKAPKVTLIYIYGSHKYSKLSDCFHKRFYKLFSSYLKMMEKSVHLPRTIFQRGLILQPFQQQCSALWDCWFALFMEIIMFSLVFTEAKVNFLLHENEVVVSW